MSVSCAGIYPQKKFNNNEWETNRDTRYEMAADIIKTKILIGKSREAVTELLGKSDFIFDANYIRYELHFNANSHNIFYVYKILSGGEDVLDIYFQNNTVVELIKRQSNYYPQKTFNRHDWDEYISARFTMSKYIISNKLLLGKTMEEVIQILGDKECFMGKDKLEYYLGFIPQSISIDPDVLSIYFENKKVVKVLQRGT
jgi:hypothetical protein